jgi:hypothetical protein
MDAYCERNWKQEKGNAEEVTLIEHHAVQKATYLCVRNFEGKKEKHAVLWEGKNTTLHYITYENPLLSIRKQQPIHPKNYSTYRISNLDGLTFERPRISDIYS